MDTQTDRQRDRQADSSIHPKTLSFMGYNKLYASKWNDHGIAPSVVHPLPKIPGLSPLPYSDASRISKLWDICPLNLAKRGHLKLRRGHCKKYYFLYIEVINWLKNSFLKPLLFK